MNKKDYIILFENLRLVKGYTKSLLIDLQRNETWNIDNEISTFLIKYNRKKVEDVILDDEKITLDLLIKNEIIFITSKPELFPTLALDWDSPFEIVTMVYDIKIFDKNTFNALLQEDKFRYSSKSLQIRFFDKINRSDLYLILQKLHDETRIMSFELVLFFDDEYSEGFYDDFVLKFKRVSVVYVYNSTDNKMMHKTDNNFGFFIFSTNSIKSEKNCGQISLSNMVININLFTESINHNSCLNRKISIDTEGYIRNCPSMKEHYGNIKNTTLQEALAHPDFKKYWFVNKDQISVCKDCEFRYICTDCRAYIENPEDMYSKPLKCGYNPYTCEWEEWSTNPLKQKAIEYYGM